MKRVLTILTTAILFVSLYACSTPRSSSDEITIEQFIETKDFPEGATMTVTVTEFVNPVVAVVEDQSGSSVNLFGVFIDGEMKDFESQGIDVGTSITIKNGKYNEYEGSIEIIEAELVSVNK